MPNIDREQLTFILNSALLAPSADNRHRIRFHVDGDTISILCTEKLQSQGGYKRVLTLLSLGAVVENLSIAASRFNIATQTSLSDSNQAELVIQIRLLPDQKPANPLWETIPLRHTNRKVRFRGPTLSHLELSELNASISAYPDTQLGWLDEPEQRDQALHLMRRAENERFRNRVLHDELFSAIHFDVGWSATCEVGLPPGALAVELPMRPLFAMLRHWPVMQLAKLFGAHYILGFRACDLPCRLAPNLGILTVKNTSTQIVFEAGQSFQRIWLTLTRQGRVLQPLPASALYALYGADSEGIPTRLQAELKLNWDIILHGDIPLMIFRTGYATPSNIKTSRQAIDYY